MGWFGSLAKSVATEAAGAAAGAVAGNATSGFRGGSRTGNLQLSDNFSGLDSVKTRTESPNKQYNTDNSLYGQTKKAKTSTERGDNIQFTTEGDNPWELTKEWDKFLKGNM
jgi:Tfp pilus assembly protein FimT